MAVGGFCDRVPELQKQARHCGLNDCLYAVAGGSGLVFRQ